MCRVTHSYEQISDWLDEYFGAVNQYWTETAADDFAPVLELWTRGRQKALAELAIDYFRHSH
jgi:hypothetical protein